MTDIMQSHTLMALGSYRFATRNGGMDKTSRDSKWRWPEQEVIGVRPVLHFVGPGSETTSIEVTIFPQFRGGFSQIDQMRAQAGLGIPHVLVDGSGRYYGEWVIESVGDGREVFLADGTARKIEFKVELKRYS